MLFLKSVAFTCGTFFNCNELHFTATKPQYGAEICPLDRLGKNLRHSPHIHGFAFCRIHICKFRLVLTKFNRFVVYYKCDILYITFAEKVCFAISGRTFSFLCIERVSQPWECLVVWTCRSHKGRHFILFAPKYILRSTCKWKTERKVT